MEDNGVMDQKLKEVGVLDVPWVCHGKLEKPTARYILDDLKDTLSTKIMRDTMVKRNSHCCQVYHWLSSTGWGK